MGPEYCSALAAANLRVNAGLMMNSYSLLLAIAILVTPLCAQTEASLLRPILENEIVAPQVAVFQLRQHILHRVAKPPAPASAEQWSAETVRLRKRLLNEVVFHGWPREWVEAPLKLKKLES
jgi:hypothetical protein